MNLVYIRFEKLKKTSLKMKGKSWSNQEMFMEIMARRFEETSNFHPSTKWEKVENRLKSNPEKINALEWMEMSGGYPVYVEWLDLDFSGFVDFSEESPEGRRSSCYDQAARLGRKKFPPEHSACEMAETAGTELLNEAEYFKLQACKTVDTKTSSWIWSPDAIRKVGGALFGDHRYGRTFIYHNGADSYYAARGFRTKLRV